MTEFLKQLADSVDRDKNVLKVENQKIGVTRDKIERRFDLWVKEQTESELLDYYKNQNKLELDFIKENNDILGGSRVELRSLLSSIMSVDATYFREDGIMTSAVNRPKIEKVLKPIEGDSTLYLDVSKTSNYKLKSYYAGYMNGIVPLRYNKDLGTYVVSYGPRANKRAYIWEGMKLDFSTGAGQVIPSIVEASPKVQTRNARVEQQAGVPQRSVERRVETPAQTLMQQEFKKTFFISHSFGGYYEAQGGSHFHGLQFNGLTSKSAIDEFNKADKKETPSLTEQLSAIGKAGGRVILDVGGINDITALGVKGFESVKEYYEKIVNNLMTHFSFQPSNIVLLGVTKVQERRNAMRTKEKLNQKIAVYNRGLQDFAKSKGCVFVARTEESGFILPLSNSRDGLHYHPKYASTVTQYLIDKVNIPPKESYQGAVADRGAFNRMPNNAAELDYLMSVYSPLLGVNKNDVKAIAMIESMMKSGARDAGSRCVGIMQIERSTLQEVRRKPSTFNHQAFGLTSSDFANPLDDWSNMRISLALLSGIERQYYDGITVQNYTKNLDSQILLAKRNRAKFEALIKKDLTNRGITIESGQYTLLLQKLQSDRGLRKRMATIGRYNGNTSTVSGGGKHWFKYAFEALLLSEYAPSKLVPRMTT